MCDFMITQREEHENDYFSPICDLVLIWIRMSYMNTFSKVEKKMKKQRMWKEKKEEGN